jgi:hypothetical protein
VEVFGMARKADRLKGLLAKDQRTAATQAQAAFLKAEDALSSLEDRERQRAARHSAPAIAQRLPAVVEEGRRK